MMVRLEWEQTTDEFVATVNLLQELEATVLVAKPEGSPNGFDEFAVEMDADTPEQTMRIIRLLLWYNDDMRRRR